ncbi:VWA domain-containing protein [Roseibium sp. HPY-6]|uniref:vWA domain-containing protein n=1 Tax=Roseibium sp. HPY-6 TaxID=3229852 RepID=UPI00338EAE94
MTLPRASRPFVEFPAILRAHGFAVSTDQTIAFLEAIGLLGPRDVIDIRRAALATLAIPRERHAEFDALFQAYFLGQSLAAPIEDEDGDDGVEAYEPSSDRIDIDQEEGDEEPGELATSAELLGRRQFAAADDADALRLLARHAPKVLPRRQSYRRSFDNRGSRIDLRRALRQALRRDGEVFDLPRTQRKTKQRRILLLIDVSGSMKEQSEASLRFAHTLVQSADSVEVFSLGTRLTRITVPMKIRNTEQALDAVGASVADFDGGTRIGEALAAFLAVPRFSAYARGAATLFLSDGLERGSPEALIDAVRKLSRVSWRLDWLSPLAADPLYEPRTEALSACLPYLDTLVPGDRVEALCNHVLNLARPA